MKRLILILAGITWLAGGALRAQSVFINEIHYDNSGADANEGVEIAGPAGIDLSTYSLVLYNGSNSLVYNTVALSGTISDQQNGFGTVFFPISGLQNGSPDGIVLAEGGSVLQFLSYEGSITAADGIAKGLTSEDIVVTEEGTTPIDFSLQLAGDGTTYTDFTWQLPAAHTYDAINSGQTFAGGVVDTLTHVFINEIHYDNASSDVDEGVEIAGPAGSDLTGWSLVLYNGSNSEAYNTVALSGSITDLQDGFGAIFFTISGLQNGSPDGIALVDAANELVQFLSYEGTITGIGGPADGIESTDIVVSESGSTPVGFSLQLGGEGAVYEDFVWEAEAASTYDAINGNQTFGEGGGEEPEPSDSTTLVFINEIHYDNASSDTNEGIEIAGPAGTDVTGWSLVLYNGNGGAPYNTFVLAGSIPDQQVGYGTIFTATAGLQNGGPDGIALVDASNTLVQFLSYEGSFTGVGGAADGIESTDIGVAETSSTPAGFSLQLGGEGTVYEDFTWEEAAASTYDAVNTNQTFLGEPVQMAFINEIHYDNSGSDVDEGIELAGTAGTDLTGWSLVLYNGNNGASYNTINLSGVVTDQDSGYGTIFFAIPGIQNGSPDGVALIDAEGAVVQFLSYEGTMTAVGGPADTMESEDIGVSESSGAAVGTSMQLIGNGTEYGDFEWLSGITNTYGAINTGQFFGVADSTAGPTPVTISEARTSTFGTPVIVSGTLTVSDQFGGPAFIQDETGGIAVFDSQLHGDGAFSIGDSVTFTANVGAFNQQVQLVEISELVDEGPQTPVLSEVISLTELGSEEGKLVTIENVRILNSSGVFFPNTNYTLEDSLGNTGDLRIDADIDLVGFTIPTGYFDVTGVIGSFRGTPQLQPRFQADIPSSTPYEPGGGIDADSTFDVVTWNMEFFGSTIENFGPQDVALQLANATEVIEALNADVIAVQEISDMDALEALADSVGYEKVCSDRFSYSFNGPDPTFPEQRLCYLYDPTTVALVGDRALMEATYDSARAGLTDVLDDYPTSTGAQSFWASGRLPYLMTIDATINGITERINLVNIHANSGASDLNRRIVDFGALKDTLDTHYADETVIILGDYNDDVDESIAGPGIESPYSSLIEDSSYQVTTYSLSLAGFKSFINGDEMIDHIAITDEFFDEFIEGSESTFLAFTLIDNFVNTTSDHLPVVSRFEFNAIPVEPITGVAVCSEDPANTRSWQLENPNKFDVTINYSVAADSGELVLLPGVTSLTTTSGGDLEVSWNNEYGEIQSIVIATIDLPCIDSTTAYFVEEVVSFNQGRRRNGSRISPPRSNPEKALQVMENRYLNFVALGMGGDITLSLNQPYFDKEGADFIVVETTFGSKWIPCSWYPEKAEIFASKFGDEFVSLGVVCRDAYVDLADGGLDWAQYLKIVDATNEHRFGPWADGYDLDGVLIRQTGDNGGRMDEEIQLDNLAIDEEIPFTVETYPNPTINTLQVNFSVQSSGSVSLQIIDQAGRIMEHKIITSNPGMNLIDLDVSELESGLYHLLVNADGEKTNVKFLKK